MSPRKYGELPRDMSTCGVYLFTENGKHLYVGRSNDLRGRYGRHCRPGATERQAAFAFQLAREKPPGASFAPTSRTNTAGRRLPTCRNFMPRSWQQRSEFGTWSTVLLRRPTRISQALLEIYCSVVLQTPYNDFKTH